MNSWNSARNGKIARLPVAVREELNRRMREGEMGKRLVAWLNTLPEVQRVMAAQFGGRVVRAQNLSEWRKRGGYREWLLREEVGLEYRLQAVRLEYRLEPVPVPPEGGTPNKPAEAGTPNELRSLSSEVLAQWVLARYAVAARWVDAAQGKEQWRLLREMSADVVALRREEHRAMRLEMMRERKPRERNRPEAGGACGGLNIERPTSNIERPTGVRFAQRKSESIRVNPSGNAKHIRVGSTRGTLVDGGSLMVDRGKERGVLLRGEKAGGGAAGFLTRIENARSLGLPLPNASSS